MPRVIITVPGRSPQPYRFQLDQKSLIIGRAHKNDIPLDSSSISSRHAEIKRANDGYELHDLGSTNGIKINGSLVSHVALRDGMSVELGEVLLGFELSPEERAILDMQATTESEAKTETARRAKFPEFPSAANEAPAESANTSSWPEPEPASSGAGSAQENPKRKRPRKKGKGGGESQANTSADNESPDPSPEATSAAVTPPAPQRARKNQPPRAKIDPEQLAKFAWKIFLAEVSEEGVALVGDNDARELSRRCCRLAEIFLEEQGRRH
jgi:pSer/pThr/pTyr-binding forkhead associated (FHA) protein